jgi:hypothetical protein
MKRFLPWICTGEERRQERRGDATRRGRRKDCKRTRKDCKRKHTVTSVRGHWGDQRDHDNWGHQGDPCELLQRDLCEPGVGGSREPATAGVPRRALTCASQAWVRQGSTCRGVAAPRGPRKIQRKQGSSAACGSGMVAECIRGPLPVRVCACPCAPRRSRPLCSIVVRRATIHMPLFVEGRGAPLFAWERSLFVCRAPSSFSGGRADSAPPPHHSS